MILIDAQLVKLFQIFGDVHLVEAEELLRKYVPKDINLGESRTAACWALGKIHEGQSEKDLIDQFVQRLSDVNSMIPETENVRLMCAIGLGRMQAQSSVKSLRDFASPGDFVGLGCWWSIQLLTGEKPPEFPDVTRQVLGWFLQPLDK